MIHKSDDESYRHELTKDSVMCDDFTGMFFCFVLFNSLTSMMELIMYEIFKVFNIIIKKGLHECKYICSGPLSGSQDF